MKISRFFGITNREAMREVRLALGPDALIISNRRVDGGVEILATDAAAVPDAEAATPAQAPGAAVSAAAPVSRSVPPPPNPPAAAPRPPLLSPKSPMGAYAAAFQAAYGVEPETTPEPQVAARVPLPPVEPQAPSAPQRPSLARSPAARVSSALPAGPEKAPAPYAGLDAENSAEPDIMDAIGAMRGALEDRIDELLWGNQLRRAPEVATLFQSLLSFGFSTALLRAMLKRLPESLSSRAAFQWAREELVAHLPVLASEDELWVPGLALALVGPTGVGKTTTLAKLAARCVRRFGPDKLVLITTDTYRIGAHEQLKIYGQMLRVPVHVVRNGDELRDIMSGLRPEQIILIDNVGISQRDRYVHEQAALLAAAGREVSRLLVINAASHGETLDEVARSYAADGGPPLKGCIISKVDEATRLGAALDTALRYRLPVHYVSTGQKVPEHLAFMTAAELVDRALTHLPSARTLYAPSEADFAALLSMTRAPGPAVHAGADETRRQQMAALPRLLSLSAGGASQLGPEDLRAGSRYIDELVCSSTAYDLWGSLLSGEPGDALPASAIPSMLRVVQNAWNESGHPQLLAVHDQVALRSAGQASARLRATMMLDAQGTPLSSVMQQVSLPEGWMSSCGASQPQAPAVRDALLHQIDWLAEHAAELPLVHLFEGGNLALWRELAGRDLVWMAQVPAITRVYLEDGSTTVQALAKTLAHQPVTDPAYLFSLTELGGNRAAGCAVWVASTPVMIASRGQQALPLQMLSVLLLDKVTGKRIRQITGLHPSLEFDVNTLAEWLVIKAEARDAMRHAASAWALLGSNTNKSDPRFQALAAAQAGLAAWQLHKSPLAAQGRELAAGLLGRKQLSSTAVPAATLKLFALKELLDA